MAGPYFNLIIPNHVPSDILNRTKKTKGAKLPQYYFQLMKTIQNNSAQFRVIRNRVRNKDLYKSIFNCKRQKDIPGFTPTCEGKWEGAQIRWLQLWPRVWTNFLPNHIGQDVWRFLHRILPTAHQLSHGGRNSKT